MLLLLVAAAAAAAAIECIIRSRAASAEERLGVLDGLAAQCDVLVVAGAQIATFLRLEDEHLLALRYDNRGGRRRGRRCRHYTLVRRRRRRLLLLLLLLWRWLKGNDQIVGRNEPVDFDIRQILVWIEVVGQVVVAIVADAGCRLIDGDDLWRRELSNKLLWLLLVLLWRLKLSVAVVLRNAEVVVVSEVGGVARHAAALAKRRQRERR